MASGPTANFAEDALRAFLLGTAVPAGSAFRVHLITSAVVPDWDATTLSAFTETPDAGTGYPSDGYAVTKTNDANGFPTIDESAANDDWRAKIKDVTVTGSGGTIGPFHYAVLTDAHATPGSRRVYSFHDLGGATSVLDGNSLTIKQTSRGEWDIGAARTA